MKLVTVSEMQEIERQADGRGLGYAEMMENAGRGVAEQVQAEFRKDSESILALVGPGNNGGDALVALVYLAAWGWHVSACLVRPRSQDDPLVQRVKDSGGQVFTLDAPQDPRLAAAVQSAAVVLDGVR